MNYGLKISPTPTVKLNNEKVMVNFFSKFNLWQVKNFRNNFCNALNAGKWGKYFFS